MQPLASAGNNRSSSSSSANTNLSTTIALSLIDEHGNDIDIQTASQQPIELIIPRDPNIIVPSFTRQNLSLSQHNQSFHPHFVNLTRSSNLTVAFHLQLRPLPQSTSTAPSPAYWLIYRFDMAPQLNSTIQLIDGWTLLCSNSSILHPLDHHYTHQIDEAHVADHRSVIFGVRETSVLEQQRYCNNHTMTINEVASLFDTPMNFSIDYELRSFTSGCYYLDKHNQWRSDGLRVSCWPSHRHCDHAASALAWQS
jgi:hypothetical protein